MSDSSLFLQLPHLEGEDYSNIIIVCCRLSNIERSLEVHSSQLGTSNGNARGAVDHLMYFLALVPELPLRLRLTIVVLSHADVLDGSEVRLLDVGITGATVQLVRQAVAVAIVETNIANTIVVLIRLIGVGDERTIIVLVHHSIIVSIIITIITNSVIVAVKLICILHVRTVVAAVRNSVKIPVTSLVTDISYQVVVRILLARI